MKPYRKVKLGSGRVCLHDGQVHTPVLIARAHACMISPVGLMLAAEDILVYVAENGSSM